jgi:hypothetical protein
MEPDHDPTKPAAPDHPLGWSPPDAPSTVTPLFTETPHESYPDMLRRLLVEADTLVDACSDLIGGMRAYGALAPVTERLVEAHGMLVTAANTLAAIR